MHMRRIALKFRDFQRATMATLPSPPFVEIPGISNFRDIGGQQTSSGKPVRKGLVFRSADPSKATEDGLKKMSQELGIKEIFDLRSTPEIRRDGPEWAGIEVDKSDVFEPYGIHRAWTPVFADADYGPEQVALRYKDYTASGSEGFVRAYYDILQSAPSAYGKIFRHLAQDDAEPMLVNCTAGKDRTGVVVAMLLTLAGVSPDATSDEYALTEIGLADLKPIFMERLLRNPTLNGNKEGVERLISSKKENMEAALKMIEKDFGGPERYMKDHCGLSDAQVLQLKKNLLGDDS